jgi:hypothetical protein
MLQSSISFKSHEHDQQATLGAAGGVSVLGSN